MFAKKTDGRFLLKLGLVLVVLAGLAVAAFNGLQKTARVKLAKPDTAVDAVTGSVMVDADGGTNKELKAEADGKVVACENIVEGRQFKEGDVLVQLDTLELERLIKETKRKYADDKRLAHIELTGGKPELVAHVEKLSDEERAKLYREVNPQRKLTVDKLEQIRRLHTLNNVSDEDLANAERALEYLDLDLQKKAFNERRGELDFKATLENFDLQMDRMQVRAPSDGEITQALIWKGAMIGRGHVVAKFMSPERVVAAKISEEDFGKVKIGQTANVRLLTYGEQNFEAKVSKLLPKADEAQRFTVFLDVKVESEDQLKPNSTGEATITVNSRPGLMIPRRALFDNDKVFVVKDGRVRKQQVKVGFLALNVAEVIEGLAKDDAVIVDRLEDFRDGDRVRTVVAP